MGKVEKIEQQVQALGREELVQFRAWFLEFDWAAWDRQIERDVRAGKLDGLAQKALRARNREDQAPLTHHASPDSWTCYKSLPGDIQELADHAFERL